MKLVHAADLHLDSALRGLSRYESAPADEIRGATRRAFTNLVNLCLDHRRRGWWQRLVVRDAIGEDPERGVLERQAAPVVDPGDALGREQLMTQLWGAVDRLSPQQRAALLLHVQEEQPTSEIAAVLQCSEATVRVHLHRAVSALRKTMGQG